MRNDCGGRFFEERFWLVWTSWGWFMSTEEVCLERLFRTWNPIETKTEESIAFHQGLDARNYLLFRRNALQLLSHFGPLGRFEYIV